MAKYTSKVVRLAPRSLLPKRAGRKSTHPADVKGGHPVLALGRPGSARPQATLGNIRPRLEAERSGQLGYILHTDAVLYPGFPGGALVNTSGQVVGLTNLVFGRGKGVAIGLPVAGQVAEALLAHGAVPRGYLGIQTQLVTLLGELGHRPS